MPPIPEGQLATVSLDYLKAYNLAARGSVEFTPPRFTLADGTVVVATPVAAAVVGGVGSVGLIPTDTGTYLVREMLDGRPAREWHINLSESYAGETVALSTLLPATPVQPGVTVNTLLSGTAAPGALTGHDGDYYYDVVAKRWYGPKAGGAWPAGFSIVGPPGVDGTDGTDGQDGTAGGTMRMAHVYLTPGNINPLPVNANWAPLPNLNLTMPAAVGDRVALGVHGMRNAQGSVYLDMGLVVAGSIRHYFGTGTAIVGAGYEGDPGWYVSSSFIGQSAPRFVTVTADHLDGGVIRASVIHKGNGTGIIYASPDYPMYLCLQNFGPAPA